MAIDVKDFGAVGDGRAMDTAAIQKAIDRCAELGGGTVIFPPGRYLTGSVSLRSNVFLELSPAATVVGSSDIADYPKDGRAEAGVVQQPTLGVIVASEATNIGIVGDGTIDGNGADFEVRGTIGRRPNLICLIRCERVVIRDLHLRNSAIYSCLLVGCKDARIRGLSIDSRVRPNNDGIDLSSCENVIVSDCRILSGDDGIALKNDVNGPCRNITISNCIISTRWAAIRIGPESFSGFYNVTISNCVIFDTFGCGIKLQMAEGGVMENIVVSNMVMNNVTGPVSIRLNDWENVERPRLGVRRLGVLRNVSISNVQASVPPRAVGHPFVEHTFQGVETSVAAADAPSESGWIVLPPNWTADGERKSCISLCGSRDAKIENVLFSDLRIVFSGGGTPEEARRNDIPELEHAYPEYFMFGVLPACGMYMRHVKGVVVRNVSFALEADDFRPAINAEDADALSIDGLKLSHRLKAVAPVRLTRCSGARVRNVTAERA